MGRENNKRRKCNDSVEMRVKCSTSPTALNTSLRKVLSQANCVLYDSDLDYLENSGLLSIFSPKSNENYVISSESSNMAEAKTNKDPTNADIMQCLLSINDKLSKLDERMNKQSQTIDTIQTKVGSFEHDLKKLWSYIHDNQNKTAERLNHVEDMVESADFNLTKMSEQVLRLERGGAEERDGVSAIAIHG
jgi:peptidoglycan hydrolase CwlO-like protein